MSHPPTKPVSLSVAWIIAALAAVVVGCGTTKSAKPPKMQQVRLGMTIEQVEQVLGRPIDASTVAGAPAFQSRVYHGDGDHLITIIFKNGTAISVDERVPKRGLPVG